MSEEISSIIDEYSNSCVLYDEFRLKIISLISDLIKNSNIKINSITSRCKTIDSLKEKIARKDNKYNSISEITDLVGLRIITYYADDVDKVAKIIEDEFNIDRDNSIDKRVTIDVDRFGYLSLHYIICLNESRKYLVEYKKYKDIKVEIQIRSLMQHAWSEIEHDSGYKGGNEIPREVKRDFYRLAGLLELADKEFMSIRNRLESYSKEVSQIIDTDPNKLAIDSITLRKFIDTNVLLKRINKTIVSYCKLELKCASEFQISNMVNQLTYVGHKTIEDVISNLENYKDDILEYSKYRLLREDDEESISFLSDTIGLLYLNFIIIAKYFTEDQINNFLSVHHIGIKGRQRDIAENFKNFLLINKN